MKKITYMDIAALVIWLIPIVYLIYIYPTLPASVPMHYGINGKVDRYGSKTEFLIFQAIMLIVGLLVYLLLKFLPLIDPKKQVKFGEETFQKIAMGLITFFSALNIIIIYSTVNQGMKIDKLILPAVGLFFAFMGNMMNSIKPNYFAGIRTPWTLESEDTWRATHRLASKIWFFGGLALTIATLLLPATAATITFMCGIAVLAFVPIVYSYTYFKSHQAN
jgi:uncharacterized membrane protein